MYHSCSLTCANASPACAIQAFEVVLGGSINKAGELQGGTQVSLSFRLSEKKQKDKVTHTCEPSLAECWGPAAAINDGAAGAAAMLRRPSPPRRCCCCRCSVRF
mgnify:CR=1 FL=1